MGSKRKNSGASPKGSVAIRLRVVGGSSVLPVSSSLLKRSSKRSKDSSKGRTICYS